LLRYCCQRFRDSGAATAAAAAAAEGETEAKGASEAAEAAAAAIVPKSRGKAAAAAAAAAASTAAAATATPKKSASQQQQQQQRQQRSPPLAQQQPLAKPRFRSGGYGHGDDSDNDAAGPVSQRSPVGFSTAAAAAGGVESDGVVAVTSLWSSAECRAWLGAQPAPALALLRARVLRWLWRHGIGPFVGAASRSLLGPGFHSRGVKCVFSGPQTALQTPHRDTVAAEINCFVALTSLAPRSGASCFFPGSHNTRGPQSGAGSGAGRGRSVQSGPVQFPLRPGDCVVFNSTLGHYGCDSREVRPMGFLSFRARTRMRAPSRVAAAAKSAADEHAAALSRRKSEAHAQPHGQGLRFAHEAYADAFSQGATDGLSQGLGTPRRSAGVGVATAGTPVSRGSSVAGSTPFVSLSQSQSHTQPLSQTQPQSDAETEAPAARARAVPLPLWAYDIDDESVFTDAVSRDGDGRPMSDGDGGAVAGGWAVPVGLTFEMHDPRFPLIFKNTEGDAYSV
jgi:hypothetical protein